MAAATTEILGLLDNLQQVLLTEAATAAVAVKPEVQQQKKHLAEALSLSLAKVPAGSLTQGEMETIFVALARVRGRVSSAIQFSKVRVQLARVLLKTAAAAPAAAVYTSKGLQPVPT